jgi:hypothetical protein
MYYLYYFWAVYEYYTFMPQFLHGGSYSVNLLYYFL